MPKKTESELVSKLRGGLSFREFEDYLNENIPQGMPGTTTFASAWNWINDVHPVNGACLMAWMAYYPKDDPRNKLAMDILERRMRAIPAYKVEDKEKLLRVIDRPKERETAK